MGEDQNDKTSCKTNNGDSSCILSHGNGGTGLDDDGPYFDMDLALPLLWDKLEDKNKSPEEFEFRISVSARTAGVSNPVDLSPADDLFYKGQLLPLHLPPRLQMVQNLSPSGDGNPEPKGECCASDSANSHGSGAWSKDSNSDSGSSRDSSGSSHDSCYSNRDSRPAEETAPHVPSFWKSAAKLKVSLLGLRKSAKIGSSDDKSRIGSNCSDKEPRFGVKSNTMSNITPTANLLCRDSARGAEEEDSSRLQKKRYHSFSYASTRNVDRDQKERINHNRTAKEVFRKYLRMIKPLYEKVSHKYDHQASFLRMDECGSNAVSVVEDSIKSSSERRWSSRVSFSGNLRIPRRNSAVGSCPSSMRSSPSHSGVLTGVHPAGGSSDSTMEELQNAIQGAIAHCKSSNVINAEPKNSRGPY